jgi:hypothetical protein
VDLVHSAWTGWRGSGPRLIEAVRTRWHDGALLMHDAQVLGLTGARWQWQRRKSQARWCWKRCIGARAAAERRRDGGEERQQLERGARAKEAAWELEREGQKGR